jgi:hypothetical protein
MQLKAFEVRIPFGYWEVDDGSHVDGAIGTFMDDAGPGTLYIKMLLAGDGNRPVRLESVNVDYE